MRRTLTLFIVLILIFVLSACGKSIDTISSNVNNESTSTENTTIHNDDSSTQTHISSNVDSSTERDKTNTVRDNSNNTQNTSKANNSIESTSSNVETSSNEQIASSPSRTEQSTSSSIHPNDEICPKRSNNLPHRWKGETCTLPKMCEYCNKEYSSPLGHTFSKDGICDTCGESVTPLIVECNGPFVFDNITMDYVDYKYNTISGKITFYFNLISPDNANIQEFFIKMILYNGNAKTDTKNVGLVDRNSYYSKYVLLESVLSKGTTKIVLENLF